MTMDLGPNHVRDGHIAEFRVLLRETLRRLDEAIDRLDRIGEKMSNTSNEFDLDVAALATAVTEISAAFAQIQSEVPADSAGLASLEASIATLTSLVPAPPVPAPEPAPAPDPTPAPAPDPNVPPATS